MPANFSNNKVGKAPNFSDRHLNIWNDLRASLLVMVLKNFHLLSRLVDD